MIHERLLSKKLQISGPLSTCIATVKATLHEIEASIAIQNEGLENLVRGSKLSLASVIERAPANLYIDAAEALELELIQGVI